MKDNKEFFELNEKELDSVVGGLNHDVAQQFNLKVFTNEAKGISCVKFCYCRSEHDGNSSSYMSGQQFGNSEILQKNLDKGSSMMFLDNNNNWVKLSTDQIKALIG